MLGNMWKQTLLHMMDFSALLWTPCVWFWKLPFYVKMSVWAFWFKRKPREKYSVCKKWRQSFWILEWRNRNVCVVFSYSQKLHRHWANKCPLVYSFSGFDSGSKNPFPMRDFLNLVKSPEKSGFQPKPINT